MRWPFMKQSLLGAFAVAVVFLTVSASGDTLFKAKDPVRIGRGTEEEGKIRWTDCDGGNGASYKRPPYTIDKSDNCAVGPPTFGLECENDRCKVVDDSKIKTYLPDAKDGDVVNLRIEEHSVVLTGNGKTVRLEK